MNNLKAPITGHTPSPNSVDASLTVAECMSGIDGLQLSM